MRVRCLHSPQIGLDQQSGAPNLDPKYYNLPCKDPEILLMIKILHDLKTQNPTHYGSIVCIGSCRISITNSRTTKLWRQPHGLGVGRELGETDLAASDQPHARPRRHDLAHRKRAGGLAGTLRGRFRGHDNNINNNTTNDNNHKNNSSGNNPNGSRKNHHNLCV